MDFDMEQDIFSTAEEHFRINEYASAEPLLNQLVLKSSKRPQVFHMLGTIYYDQGKFNKAIRSFKRALELDPGFTDSSIGLSVILNDLGRYEEGQKVFDEARSMLTTKNPAQDVALNEKFATKHDELGEMYLQHSRVDAAIEQFQKALSLTTLRRPELSVSIAECHILMRNLNLAIRELRLIVREYPHFVPARLKLGKCYFDSQQIPEAIEQWESAQNIEPKNPSVRDYLRLAQSIQVTSLNRPEIDL
jgi:tetratricopeptide (TPR) repeat protein